MSTTRSSFTTVREIAFDVRASINTDANLLQCAQWISNRYQQLMSRGRFSHLREVAQVVVKAAVTLGHVNVALGSNLVEISDPIALAAINTIGEGLQDYWFRGQTNWYKIVGTNWRPTGTLELILEATYADQASNANSGYHICKRFTRLDPRARWLGETMLLQNRNVTISRMSPAEMDLAYPRRPIVSGFGPIWWCQQGLDEESQAIVVEFYPYSTVDHLVHYILWAHPGKLEIDDPIPPQIDGYILKEGALIDAMRFEAAKAIKAGSADMAGYWTNNYRSQATQWERNILEAIRNDRGTNDIALMLRTGWERRPRDVVSARDELYARGNRP